MSDDSDPPRKYYDFKPREFERENPSPRSEPSPPEVRCPPASPADPSRPIDVHELHRQAAVPGPVLSRKRPGGGPNDVQTILRENLARENAAGLNKLPYRPPRKSRRRRDYWMLMIATWVVFGYLAVTALASSNAILFVYSVAAIGLISAATTWVMWFVMDDY